ncbi:hypothetical protein CQA49_09650 [Helicobacter sp. MIT 00-7814]|nr:hypothetical protein CQA49_09650 [Helicobacter sp. MIT 00-7814]
MLSHYRLGSSLRIFFENRKNHCKSLEFSKWHTPTKKGYVWSRSWSRSGIHFREGKSGAEAKCDLLAQDDTNKKE